MLLLLSWHVAELAESSGAKVHYNLHSSKGRYLRQCLCELETGKELSILGVLGSTRDASQHKAGDQLEVDFDVKPGRHTQTFG